MSSDAATMVCDLCKGARWVRDGKTAVPWHPFATSAHGFGGTGIPCPACNDRAFGLPWAEVCLACVSWEEFMKQQPEDPDVVLAALEDQLSDVAETFNLIDDTEPSVGDFTDLELIAELHVTRDRLLALREMLNPKTETGRELHSRRAALLIEMRHRKLR